MHLAALILAAALVPPVVHVHAIKGDTPASYRVRKKRGPPKWPGIGNVVMNQGEIPVSVRIEGCKSTRREKSVDCA